MGTDVCVCVCVCVGQHRGLGTMVSKVQSLKLDTSVWSNEVVQVRPAGPRTHTHTHTHWPSVVSALCVCQLFIMLGNDRANAFWASRLPPPEQLACSAPPDQRRDFISRKYREGRYRRPHRGVSCQEELLKVKVTPTHMTPPLSLSL